MWLCVCDLARAMDEVLRANRAYEVCGPRGCVDDAVALQAPPTTEPGALLPLVLCSFVLAWARPFFRAPKGGASAGPSAEK